MDNKNQTSEEVKPASSESGVKSQKKAKSLTLRQRQRKTVIVACCIGVVSAGLGAIGGILLYRNNHPDVGSINLPVNDNNDNTTPAQKAKLVKASLDKGTILEDYKDKPYLIYQYASYLQSSSPYALTVGKAVVISSGVESDIQSGTYSSPEAVFNQNISATNSTLIHIDTAFRFYDKKDGNVTAYECKHASDWAAEGIKPTEVYSYDDYIQTYGKLNKGAYYCSDVSTSAVTPIPDKYLTDDAEVYTQSKDTTKHFVDGVVVYSLFASTVLTSSFTKTEQGYHLEFDLDPQTANSYYSVQMKKTGNLASYPSFTSSKLTFELGEDLGLISSHFSDKYSVKVSFINSSATQEMTQYYFRSASSSFVSGDKTVEVKVPDIADTVFNGLDLYPAA
ncbi:MAG: hypothetical protein LKJ88_03555 [Bacilli bacterium]|jgi:hypothetical protein|nr:hypothetical protein [Bacilli bacterium]